MKIISVVAMFRLATSVLGAPSKSSSDGFLAPEPSSNACPESPRADTSAASFSCVGHGLAGQSRFLPETEQPQQQQASSGSSCSVITERERAEEENASDRTCATASHAKHLQCYHYHDHCYDDTPLSSPWPQDHASSTSKSARDLLLPVCEPLAQQLGYFRTASEVTRLRQASSWLNKGMPGPTVQQRAELAVAQIERNYQERLKDDEQTDYTHHHRRRHAELKKFEKLPQEIRDAEPVAVAAIECGLIQTPEEYLAHIPPALQRSSPNVVIAALRKNLMEDWLGKWFLPASETGTAEGDWLEDWEPMENLADAEDLDFSVGVRQSNQLPESLRHDEDVVRSLLDVGAYRHGDWVALPDFVRSNENNVLAAIHTRAAKTRMGDTTGYTQLVLGGWPHQRDEGTTIRRSPAGWFFQLPEATRKQEGVVLAALDRGLLDWGHPEHVPQSLKRTSANLFAAVIGRSLASPIRTREQWDRDVPPALKVDPRVVVSGIRAGLLTDWDNAADFPEEVRGVEDVVAAAIGKGVLEKRAQWDGLPKKIRHSQSLRRRAVVPEKPTTQAAEDVGVAVDDHNTTVGTHHLEDGGNGKDLLFHSGQTLP
eukprot:g11329.t1